MPDTLDDFLMMRPPTPERPLLGAVILVVEDSRHACEAIRLVCQRSGARIRRAESLASAERHLCSYRPRIAVVDLGLPDGSGLDLVARLARAEPRIDGIVATSGDETRRKAAEMAGADVFLAKPIASVAGFRDVILGLVPEALRPARVVAPADDAVLPDPMSLRDDLCHAADLLGADPDRRTLDYVAAFLASLGKSAGDPGLGEIGRAVAALAAGDGAATPARLAAAVAARIRGLAVV